MKGIRLKNTKILVSLHLIWMATVSLIAGWWSHLLSYQASEIVDLKIKLGLDAQSAEILRARTERMVFWESAFFFSVLILISGAVLWLYLRDLKRNRSIQGFFASLTHELKTPLTSIRLQSETLLDRPQFPAKEKELVSKILVDAERLSVQVERALELARIEGGGGLNVQSIPLKDYFEQLPSEYKDVTFKMQLEAIEVQADRHALDIILRNIVDNAQKHTQSKHPTLTITGHGVDTDSYEVKITDNGSSVPEIDEKKLGELFHRGSRSQGAGVGLYLIRTLMEKMSGLARFSKSAHSTGQFVVELYFRRGGGSP